MFPFALPRSLLFRPVLSIMILALTGCSFPISAAPTREISIATIFPTPVQIVETRIPQITETLTATPTVATPTSLPTDASTPELTTSPTAAHSPTPTADELFQVTPTREIMYQDDFEATQGWYTFEGDRFRFEYKSGAYMIYNNLLEAVVNSVRTQNHTDVVLEVDAARSSGPPNGYFGLVCRFQDDSNYYALVLGSDGYYGIARLQGGKITFISLPPSPNDAINAGFANNRIRASCIGDTLTLYTNGVKLTEASDDTFDSGFVGLAVGTKSVAGLEVLFDNFTILKP